MRNELSALLPATKFDTEKAAVLVALGFRAVEPVMLQILEWLQDLNWPVGHVLRPFLVSIGSPLAPYIRVVLEGQDDGWKYSLLRGVVDQSIELAQALRPELERIATNPSPGESREEVDQAAAEMLVVLNGGTSEA